MMILYVLHVMDCFQLLSAALTNTTFAPMEFFLKTYYSSFSNQLEDLSFNLFGTGKCAIEMSRD